MFAAIRYSDGTLFTGRRHAVCLAKANRMDAPETGFVTSKGRFVSREEAAKIAHAAGQISQPIERLESEEVIE